jgi:SnoaL-like protein
MSANVNLVRSICAAWEHDDFGSLTWADAEIELIVVDGPEPVSLRGLRAALEYWRRFLGAWKGYSIVVDDCRWLDEERVLVLVRAGRGEGDRSGVQRGGRGGGGAQVFTVREGKVTRLVTYFNRERGLAELGLAEPDVST